MSDDDKIIALVLPIMKALGKPVTCVDLGRVCALDTSQVFRALMNCAEVAHERSTELTRFWVKA